MVSLGQLLEFEAEIKVILAHFENTFGCRNPVPLRMQGKIPSKGYLRQGASEYSLHGGGCTVESHGRIVSFDFDSNGGYCYTAFKFRLFLNDENVDSSAIAMDFEAFLEKGDLVSIPGCGVRLASCEN